MGDSVDGCLYVCLTNQRLVLTVTLTAPGRLGLAPPPLRTATTWLAALLTDGCSDSCSGGDGISHWPLRRKPLQPGSKRFPQHVRWTVYIHFHPLEKKKGASRPLTLLPKCCHLPRLKTTSVQSQPVNTRSHWRSTGWCVFDAGEVHIHSRHFGIFKCSSLTKTNLYAGFIPVYSSLPAVKEQKLWLVCIRKQHSSVEGRSHKQGCVLPSNASFPASF